MRRTKKVAERVGTSLLDTSASAHIDASARRSYAASCGPTDAERSPCALNGGGTSWVYCQPHERTAAASGAARVFLELLTFGRPRGATRPPPPGHGVDKRGLRVAEHPRN